MTHYATANSVMPKSAASFAYAGTAAASLLFIHTSNVLLGVSFVLGLILVLSVLAVRIRRKLLFER